MLEQLQKEKLPKHIAIIMDGNGRWAKEKGQDRVYGHQNGVHSVRAMVEACGELQIDFLTLYAFSTENWNRPASEVQALMELLVSTIRKEVDDLHKNKVRLLVIGDRASLPENCNRELDEAIKITENNKGLSLVLALSYSAKWEILAAVKQIALETKEGKIDIEHINDELFKNYLSTKNIPDPELLIRTSGEHRISNFLLYQLAYAELYFTETHWPDFRKEHLHKALLDYIHRERRFGKTSEQLNIT